MECNRDEAKRAKEIAERKFGSKDITGAKKFALKAQSLYPGLDGISQFLATLDVYVAAENKINGESDLYGILGVSPLADDDAVKKHYRKLALSLHPDKNKSTGAEGAFQIVSQAWTLLSDKQKRSMYDRKTNLSKQKVYTQNGAPKPPNLSKQKVYTQNGAPKPPTNNGFHKFSTAQTRVTSTKAKGTTNSPKDSITKTQTCPSRTGTSPAKTGSKDDINAATKTEMCPTETGADPVKTGFNKAGAGPTKTGPASVHSSSNKQMTRKTFWTVCKRCKLQYEFVRMYLNRTLLCSTCHGPFHATETPPPNTNSSSQKAKGSNKDGSNPETCKTTVVDPVGKFPSMNGVKRDREEAGTGEEASRRKISKLTSQTNQNNNGFLANNRKGPTEVKKDGNIKNRLIKKATMEIKKKLNEWSSEDSLTGGSKSLVTDDVPDSEFHDFDCDRSKKCFAEGQLWAGYDELDGMPRLYAMVKKLISLKPFKMKVCWFDPKPDNKPGLVSRSSKAAFGEFKPGKHQTVSSPNYFSHKANFTKQTTETGTTVCVYPRKGDVCALYRNDQTSDLVESSYEIVEVDAYDEETGTTVTPLIKVSGYKTVFHRHQDPNETRVVEKKDMFLFSHQIPSCLLTGKETAAREGCLELDPAALPPQFLQVEENMVKDDDDDDQMAEKDCVSVEGDSKC